MTITKKIPVEQFESLDLHLGDSLRVVAEKGATFLIQIVRAAEPPPTTKRSSAGAWARKYAGVARLDQGQSTDDVRMIHYRRGTRTQHGLLSGGKTNSRSGCVLAFFSTLAGFAHAPVHGRPLPCQMEQ